MNVPALAEKRIAIGEATFAPSSRTLERDGQEQRLEPRLAQLLETFCEHPGEVLQREELLDRVWGDEGSDEALTQAVSRLRQLLGDRALIQTEPRKGYRLTVQPIAASDVDEPEVTTEEPDARVLLRGTVYTSRTVQLAFVSGLILGLMAAAIVALVAWPSPVTVTREITQLPGEEPVSDSSRCDGTPEECESALD